MEKTRPIKRECFFCGGAQGVYEVTDYEDPGLVVYAVVCDICEARGPKAYPSIAAELLYERAFEKKEDVREGSEGNG